MTESKKVVLITGGSRGIGKACVELTARSGFDVAFSYYSSQEKAQAIVEALTTETGRRVKAYASDAGDTKACQALVDAVVADFGSLDVLVNNAGITRDTLMIRMKDEDWDAVLQTNLTGVFHTTRAAGKVMMKQRQGCIINISSVVGVYGNAGQVNYASAKAGVIGLTKTVAKELGARGVTCNAIAPGFIETDMTGDLPHKEQLLNAVPLKRFGRPEDIAETVLFLATKGAYITGQVIGVDGGLVF
ncbi:MAG: 3-oxoacyl-[acyl-carrier-protein] reductase [Vampirovibrio sp.]